MPPFLRSAWATSDRTQRVIVGLAVSVALWLGLTAPSTSPVAGPAPPAVVTVTPASVSHDVPRVGAR